MTGSKQPDVQRSGRSIRWWSVVFAVLGIVAFIRVDNLAIRVVLAIALVGLVPVNYMVSETIKRQSSQGQ